MLIPSVNLGATYYTEDGAIQDEPGFLQSPNRQGLYVGAGAGPVGSGNVPIPGVSLFAHLGDAVYEPLAARQRVAVRQSDASAGAQ